MSWHVEFEPPKKEGVCDVCGGELFQRDDDLPETVRRRLEVYDEETAPLVGFYDSLGLLVTVPAQGPVEEMTDRAISALESVKLPSR